MVIFESTQKGEPLLKKYEKNYIDRTTLMLLPLFEGDFKTRIVTTHGEYFSVLPILQLIDRACMQYASTYDGRVKATRYNLKQFKKTSILFSPQGVGVAAFPTKSATQAECVWIFNHDFRIEYVAPAKTRIIFDRYNFLHVLDISVHTLEKQRTRMHEMLYYYMKVRDRHDL